MIRTSKQLKDKVRNLSHSNSMIAQTLIRNFMMELNHSQVSRHNFREMVLGTTV